MSGDEMIDLKADIYQSNTVRADSDSASAWSLDESLAVVISAPASIFNSSPNDQHERWKCLADDFYVELSRVFTNSFSGIQFTPKREPYRRPLPNTGNIVPDLSELQSVASSANGIVQTLSGWIALADLARQLPSLWGSVVSYRGESGRGSDLPDPPILSKPLIRALCVADLDQKYGIEDMPQIAHEVRGDVMGSASHPVGSEHHVVAAVFGSEIRQSIVYIVSSHGALVEKFCITTGDGLALDLLGTSWIGGRDRFARECP